MSANNYKVISSHIESIQNNDNFESTIKRYVELMKQNGKSSIVSMNDFIKENNLWSEFSAIQRLNTYKYESKIIEKIGISREAYSQIVKLYKTTDVIKSQLIKSTKMYQKTIQFDDWEYR